MSNSNSEQAHLALLFEPGSWAVRLVTGQVVNVRADGFSDDGEHYVFTVVMKGTPNFELAVARFPKLAVDDIWGGPDPTGHEV